jgi:hypothetical protein
MNIIPLPSPEPESDPFADFWLLYPRHIAKLAARKAWAKIDAAQHIPILTALTAWRQVWRDKDPEYLPHAASWLNGERWEDELPPGYAKRTDPARIGPVGNDPAQPVRMAMPDHVRALLAKLRGKA